MAAQPQKSLSKGAPATASVLTEDISFRLLLRVPVDSSLREGLIRFLTAEASELRILSKASFAAHGSGTASADEIAMRCDVCTRSGARLPLPIVGNTCNIQGDEALVPILSQSLIDSIGTAGTSLANSIGAACLPEAAAVSCTKTADSSSTKAEGKQKAEDEQEAEGKQKSEDEQKAEGKHKAEDEQKSEDERKAEDGRKAEDEWKAEGKQEPGTRLSISELQPPFRNVISSVGWQATSVWGTGERNSSGTEKLKDVRESNSSAPEKLKDIGERHSSGTEKPKAQVEESIGGRREVVRGPWVPYCAGISDIVSSSDLVEADVHGPSWVQHTLCQLACGGESALRLATLGVVGVSGHTVSRKAILQSLKGEAIQATHDSERRRHLSQEVSLDSASDKDKSGRKGEAKEAPPRDGRDSGKAVGPTAHASSPLSLDGHSNSHEAGERELSQSAGRVTWELPTGDMRESPRRAIPGWWKAPPSLGKRGRDCRGLESDETRAHAEAAMRPIPISDRKPEMRVLSTN